MDIVSIIRQRLKDLGIEQRELALAAGVTESYISQLLAKKKTPPAPGRTRIYGKIAKVLKLSSEQLAALADEQRREELRRKVIHPPRPLYPELRRLILKKCSAGQKARIAHIFEREPFGEIERFVAQQLLDVSNRAVKEDWAGPKRPPRLHTFENGSSLLGPLIERWNLELASFSMQIALNPKLARRPWRAFSFQEEQPPKPEIPVEPGFQAFLNDEKLSAGMTEPERTFLSKLTFEGKRPSALYFYRELQNLRDPLNFLPLTITRKRAVKSPAP